MIDEHRGLASERGEDGLHDVLGELGVAADAAPWALASID
jgi:hypothetical protein